MKLSVKKGRNWKRILFFIFFGAAVIFALNFFQNPVRNFFYLISSPFQANLWQAGNKMSDFFETIAEIKNLKRENEELKLKIGLMASENARLKELKEENEFLKAALNIGMEKDYKLTAVQVIAKNVSEDALVINKGSKHGLRENLPVLTEQRNLAGKITEVYEDFSRVTLISSKKCSFDAKIQDKETYGVVKGRGNFKAFLDLVEQDKELKEQDILVTSVLGGIFPPGILVGEIKEIKRSDLEPFQQAEIRLFFNIKDSFNLFVIDFD